MMKIITNSKNISYRNIFCNYTCPFMSRLQATVLWGASQCHVSWPAIEDTGYTLSSSLCFWDIRGVCSIFSVILTHINIKDMEENKYLAAGSRHIAYWVRICNSSTGILSLLGASVRNSAHDKGHEEGGSAYAKAGSSLRSPPWKFSSIYPPNQSLPTFCFLLSPTPLTFKGAVPHYISLKKELAYSSS